MAVISRGWLRPPPCTGPGCEWARRWPGQAACAAQQLDQKKAAGLVLGVTAAPRSASLWGLELLSQRISRGSGGSQWLPVAPSPRAPCTSGAGADRARVPVPGSADGTGFLSCARNPRGGISSPVPPRAGKDSTAGQRNTEKPGAPSPGKTPAAVRFHDGSWASTLGALPSARR